MNNQKGLPRFRLVEAGVIHLVIPLLLLLAVAGAVALIYFGVIKNPLKNLKIVESGPKVTLKTEYKNPFKKESQYVNPFEEYKNPFVVNR